MAALIAGNSNLWLGPLGNCRIEFDGDTLGKTTEDTSITKDEDRKDIIYSQDGTKASDHISTGVAYLVNATFGEISTELLKKLLYGFSSEVSNPAAEDDSGTFGRYIYTSLRTNIAKSLKIYATDENGAARSGAKDIMCFYEALPLVEENIANWGADTQRNLPVQFYLYFKEFGTDQVSGGPYGAFGYYGDPAKELVPAVT